MMSFGTEIAGHHVPQISSVLQRSTLDLERGFHIDFIVLGSTAINIITVALLLLLLYFRQHPVPLTKL